MPESCVCFGEVGRLHDFFQGWFRGDLDPGDFARDELLAALHRHRGRETASFAIETVGMN